MTVAVDVMILTTHHAKVSLNRNRVAALHDGSTVLIAQVTCGSVVKLQHTSTGHLLHSHDISYGSGSGQQSVTGFSGENDGNSYWVVRGAEVRWIGSSHMVTFAVRAMLDQASSVRSGQAGDNCSSFWFLSLWPPRDHANWSTGPRRSHLGLV